MTDEPPKPKPISADDAPHIQNDSDEPLPSDDETVPNEESQPERPTAP